MNFTHRLLTEPEIMNLFTKSTKTHCEIGLSYCYSYQTAKSRWKGLLSVECTREAIRRQSVLLHTELSTGPKARDRLRKATAGRQPLPAARRAAANMGVREPFSTFSGKWFFGPHFFTPWAKSCQGLQYPAFAARD